MGFPVPTALQRIHQLAYEHGLAWQIAPSPEHAGYYVIQIGNYKWTMDNFFEEAIFEAYIGLRVAIEKDKSGGRWG